VAPSTSRGTTTGCSYSGYWDALPDADPTHLEQMAETPFMEDAHWARERAHRVVIRPERKPDTYFWAGVGAKPEDLREVSDFSD
jgi:hypothetical protein